jgi:hypothetical protein
MRRRDLGNWQEALLLFDRALKRKALEGERIKFYGRRRFPTYLPRFYVAEALFMLRSYSQALEMWEDYGAGGRYAPILPRRERQLLARYREEYDTRLFPAEVGTLAGHMFTARAALRSIEAATKEFPAERWRELEPRLGRRPEECPAAPTALAGLHSCLEQAEARLARAHESKDYRLVAETRGLLEGVVFTLIDLQRAIGSGGEAIRTGQIGAGRPERRLAVIGRPSFASWSPRASPLRRMTSLRAGMAENEPPVTTGCARPAIPEPRYSERHALLIGISAYQSWTPLPGVETDIEAVRETLCNDLGYDTVKVVSPLDRRTLEEEITRFLETAGKKPDNQVFLYYAGHGQTIERYGQRLGLMVPGDAAAYDPSNEDPFLDSAVSMGVIETAVRKMNARHAFFVFDSCFAGVLFDQLAAAVAVIASHTPGGAAGPARGAVAVDGEPPDATPEIRRARTIKALLDHPVRWYLTAGTAVQRVPDSSIFCRSFVAGLRERVQRRYGYIVTDLDLSLFVQFAVREASGETQLPMFGQLGLAAPIALGRVLFHFPQ